MKFDRVVVGIDFAPASLAALRWARLLARPGATLVAVHVVEAAFFLAPPEGGGAPPGLDDDLLRGARLHLSAVTEEAAVQGFRIEHAAAIGRPADALVEASRDADLTIVGTHGRGALARVVLGSVAEEVARRSQVPTLVIRDTDEGQPAVERVIVAVDPAGTSREVIVAAADLARRLGRPLEAIHALYLPPLLPSLDRSALHKMNDVLATRLQEAPAQVRKIVEEAAGTDVKVQLVLGPPADEVARRLSPRDVLVCGTHGRSALGRAVFGSVATKLLRSAPCPVLVVRPRAGTAV